MGQFWVEGKNPPAATLYPIISFHYFSLLMMKIQKTNLLIQITISFFLLISLFFPLLTRGASGAEKVKTVSTTGVAPAGLDTSRKEAIQDALRNAVKEGMGTFVTADLMVKNKEIVDEKILSRTEGYVQDYRILNEEETGGLYRVEIEATVKLGELKNELKAIGLLLERKQMPRVMVMVGTRVGNNYLFFETNDWVSTVKSIVEEAFLEKKFTLVDYDVTQYKKNIEMASGDVSEIAAIAKHIGAEVLVIGESTRSFDRFANVFGTQYTFYRTEVQLRVVEAGTGRVIFSGAKQGSSSATLEPLNEAAKLLTGEAIEALLQKWSSDVSNSTTFLLKIKKISFSRLMKFEKAVQNIKGMENLRRRSFAGKEAHMEVDFVGNTDELAERLMSIPGLRVEIIGLNQQTLDLEIN